MPANKDFKRLVRARMDRTGESYVSARRQLLARGQRGRTDFVVVVADENALVRGGFFWALRLELPEAEVLEAGSVDEAIAVCARRHVDVLVATRLDEDRVAAARAARPGLRVVAVTSQPGQSHGADAAFSDEGSAEEFVATVRDVGG